MSDQFEFKSDEEYIEAQRSLTLRKLNKTLKAQGPEAKQRVFTSAKVVDAIQEHYKESHRGGIYTKIYGLCHGVRQGGELDLFEDRFGGDWIGTEIVEELCDGERVIHADFSDPPRKEWIGNFDIVYSNSLDHARNPYKTVKSWLSCLSPDGCLYIEWTRWHNKLGRRGNKADCFAATEEEYMLLLAAAGRGDDVIEIEDGSGSRRFRRLIFPVR